MVTPSPRPHHGGSPPDVEFCHAMHFLVSVTTVFVTALAIAAFTSPWTGLGL